MARGYKIFPRSQKFRDNWDETFSKKPKWTPTKKQIELMESTEPLVMYGGCRGGSTKTRMLPIRILRGRDIKGITE